MRWSDRTFGTRDANVSDRFANGGVGANSLWQMAGRQGGGRIEVDLEGGANRESGPVRVSASPFNPYNGTGTVGTIAGIEGTLTGNAFVRSAPGPRIAVPAPVLFTPKPGADHHGRLQIIQIDRN